MQSWELLVREQVRDTISRYTHAGDGGRIEELAACFLPDGVLEVKGRPPAQGRAAISALLNPTDGPLERPAHRFVRHSVTGVHITVQSPARAEAVSYFLVVTADGPDHWGRYRDTFAPHEDAWLFGHRRVTIDARVAHSYLPPDL